MKRIFLAALFLLLSPALVQAESCHTITTKQDVFNGYGAAWNVFSDTFEPLITANCDDTGTVDVALGTGKNSEIIWHKAFYTKDGENWNQITITTGDKWEEYENWYLGNMSGEIYLADDELREVNFIAIYQCLFEDKEWKCGCRDAETCHPEGDWNIQTFSYSVENNGEDGDDGNNEDNEDSGDGGDGGDSGDDGGQETVSCNKQTYYGSATWYESEPGGACGYYEASRNPRYSVAINGEQWEGSTNCGRCVEITGPKGTIEAVVTDLCPADEANPSCRTGHLDLIPDAFEAAIGDTSMGFSDDVQWKFVPCESNDPLYFYFQPGSHEWWTSISVRNARHGIKSIEFKNTEGNYTLMDQSDYGFIIGNNMGVGPYDLRVTDMYDQTITETGIELRPDGYSDGENQFPACVE